MTIAWIIPVMYSIYLLGLMIQNGFNSASNKPIISYGLLTKPYIIALLIIGTMLLDLGIQWIENKLREDM